MKAQVVAKAPVQAPDSTRKFIRGWKEPLTHKELVERACDCILADLDNLITLMKKYGSKNVAENGPRWTWSSITKGPYEGGYVGYGLGDKWLGLGFLEGPVAVELRRRLKEEARELRESKPETYDTMLGSVTAQDTIFVTPKGTFMLASTYTCFIEKKVR